ncbi:MAG: GNAT family protein [bacterium]
MTDTVNVYGQPVGALMGGWTPRPLPLRAPLPGRYCRVEPLDVALHAEDLYAAYMEAPDDRDWTYMFTNKPPDSGVYHDWVSSVSVVADPLQFAIVDAVSRKALGTATLMRIDPQHGVIEVGGITYSRRLQKSRAGTEAMYLLMRHAFDDLGYRRYEWKCDSLNAPSIAAAKRYGFTYEGIFRQAVVYKGRNRDTAWFSVIDSEWPRVKAAFEGWLSEDNFDAAGRQRRSLASIRGA